MTYIGPIRRLKFYTERSNPWASLNVPRPSLLFDHAHLIMLTETHSPLISTVSHNGPNTTHSLSTLKDGDLPPPAKSQSELDREIANDQHELDVYGDDDPHEPTPEKTPPSPPNGKDKNMVDWDGPGDPTNPQNWTVGFRWMISALCCLITVNV